MITDCDHARREDKAEKNVSQIYEKTDYLWIVKPHASSRGRGIFVLQELSDIPLDCLTVISRYVHTPYLIQGLKFDLRLYVLVGREMVLLDGREKCLVQK